MTRSLLALWISLITLLIASSLPVPAFFHNKADSEQAASFEQVTWDQLVPAEAYSFLDEYSEDDETMWEDPAFLSRLDAADRATVTDLNGKKVSIPGFMVPLDFEADKVTEFMLVPNPGACIHVPPPPPNQNILASTNNPVKQRDLFTPIVLKGELFARTEKNELGETGYYLVVDGIEDYTDPNY